MTHAETEAEGFSRRLTAALNRAGVPVRASVIEREFNLVYEGPRDISPQAVRKWLTGQSIPRQDKLETLAHWLGVSPQYLRYGNEPIASVTESTGQVHYLPDEALTLAQDFQRLSLKERRAIRALVNSLLGATD